MLSLRRKAIFPTNVFLLQICAESRLCSALFRLRLIEMSLYLDVLTVSKLDGSHLMYSRLSFRQTTETMLKNIYVYSRQSGVCFPMKLKEGEFCRMQFERHFKSSSAPLDVFLLTMPLHYDTGKPSRSEQCLSLFPKRLKTCHVPK